MKFIKNSFLALIAVVMFASPVFGGFWLVSHQAVDAVAPDGDCLDGTYILAWDGNHASGANYICHTSGAGTISGVNTGPLDLSTSHGEDAGSYGARMATNDYRVDWPQTANQYLDMSSAQTIWMRVYVEGTPDNTLHLFESALGSLDYIGIYVGSSSYAGVYKANGILDTAGGGSWVGAGWYDIAYSWDFTGTNHSFKNGAAAWSTDGVGELLDTPTGGTDDIKLGNFTIWQTAATSTNGVRVDKFALVNGYKTASPWAQTFFLTETFEASEYDNTIPCGVVPCINEDPSPNPDGDFSTVGLDMEGSLCARVDAAGWIDFKHTAQDQATVYYMFKWRYENTLAGTEGIAQIRSGSTFLGLIYAYTNGELKAYASSASAAIATTHAVDTSLWLKIKATEGTGTDTELCLSGWDGSAWDTYACASAGTITGDIDILRLVNGQPTLGVDYQYFDAVKTSNMDFTNDPTTY